MAKDLTKKQQELLEYVDGLWGSERRWPRVREAAEHFGVTQPTMSVRLRWLRSSGLVSGATSREGGWTRGAPKWRRLREWLGEGAKLYPVTEHRLSDPRIPEGALLLFDGRRKPKSGDIVERNGKIWHYLVNKRADGSESVTLRNLQDAGNSWPMVVNAAAVDVGGVLRFVVWSPCGLDDGEQNRHLADDFIYRPNTVPNANTEPVRYEEPPLRPAAALAEAPSTAPAADDGLSCAFEEGEPEAEPAEDPLAFLADDEA